MDTFLYKLNLFSLFFRQKRRTHTKFPPALFQRSKNSYVILPPARKKLTTTRREYISDTVFPSITRCESTCCALPPCIYDISRHVRFLEKINPHENQTVLANRTNSSPCARSWKLPSALRRDLRANRAFRTSPEFVIFRRGKFVKATLMPRAPQYHWNNRNVVDEALRGVLNSRTRARLITKELYRTWAKSVGEVKQTDGLLISSWWTFARALPRDFGIVGNFVRSDLLPARARAFS